MVLAVWEFRRSRRIRLYIRRLGFLEFMRSVFVAILATNPTRSSSLLPSIRNSRALQGAIRSSVSPNPASEFPLAIIPVHIPPRPFLFSCLYRLPGAVNEPNHYPCVLGRVQCPPKNKVYPGPLGLIPNASRKQTDNAGPAKLRHQGI